MTRYEFNASYSEELVRDAERRYFVYRLRHDFWIFHLCMAALLGYVVYGAFQREWSGTYLKAVIGLTFGLVMVLLVYRATVRFGLSKLTAMGVPSAAIALTDEGLTAISGSGDGTVSWNEFEAVVETPEFWLLRLKDKSKLTIPPRGVDPSALSFIRSKVGGTGHAV